MDDRSLSMDRLTANRSMCCPALLHGVETNQKGENSTESLVFRSRAVATTAGLQRPQETDSYGCVRAAGCPKTKT